MNTTSNPFQQLSDEQILKRNHELLLMHHKLEQIQESWWAKFFRFENTALFTQFEDRFRVYRTIRLRLDDIIYMLLLICICVVFYVLPVHNDDESHPLNRGFENFLIYLIIFSQVWLLSPHWFKHVFNLGILLVYPILLLLVFFNIITFDATSSATTTQFPDSLFPFFSVFTLVPTLVALYIVYPIKEFIRNKIGSLYSYLFALSLLALFMIWPFYSFNNEYMNNQKITYSFISENPALIITFLVIITFSFHLLTHHIFFQGDLKQTRRYLLLDFTPVEISTQVQALTDQVLQQSFVYRNYEVYTRTMSGIVFLFTSSIVIYSFVFISKNSIEHIIEGIGVMVFAIFFLVYGCILHMLPLSRPMTLFASSVVSVIPAMFSSLYYQQSFYRYVFLSCFMPETTIFWGIVRSLSHRRPFLKINILVILFICIHTPICFYILNSFQILTSEVSAQTIINYSIIGLISLISVVGISIFIGWLCLSVKELPAEQQLPDKTVNYNYHDPSNPPYVPYKKLQLFSLAWLGSLDIRNVSQLFASICFICCELGAMYVLNELLFSIDMSSLHSDQSLEIVQSQFVIVFMFFCYCYIYITIEPRSSVHTVVIVLFLIFGLSCIGLSYGLTAAQVGGIASYDFTLRLVGGSLLGVSGLGIALLVIKRRNPQIDNFLSGIITMFLWIFLILPYVMAAPIISVYISTQQFGMFVYYTILFTTALLLLLVSTVSMVFNLLMGKFEEEKKIKYVMEDVETYLKDEGVETEDEIMHIIYESFEYRDEKYVYYMKRGYPVRLWVEPKEKNDRNAVENVKTIVYNHEDLSRKASLSKMSKMYTQNNDCCWDFLTLLCGTDEDEMQQKVQVIEEQNLISQDEMEELIPKSQLKRLFVGSKGEDEIEDRKERTNPALFYSSKSVTLRNLTPAQKFLGEEYSQLKNSVKHPSSPLYKQVVVGVWDCIFAFLANDDDPPPKIIYNDFLRFYEILQLPEAIVSRKEIDELYFDYASVGWKSISALCFQDFAVIVEDLSERAIEFRRQHKNQMMDLPPAANINFFMVHHVYPKLCCYRDFQDAIITERRIGSKNSGIGAALSETRETQNSPFWGSYDQYKATSAVNKLKKQKLNKHRRNYQAAQLVEPAQQDSFDAEADRNSKQKGSKVDETAHSQQLEGKSCKRAIYDKYRYIKNCCRSEQEAERMVKRRKVKSWTFLAVEIIKIMQQKQLQWREIKNVEKDYELRPIFNNILIAMFKLLDLYTYLEITLMNPKIEWQDQRQFSILLIEYKLQFYIALGLIVFCVILGIRGITFILEDRLGLTETRVPATFPHPMFIFTMVYKLLILALFNTIIMTLLSTFMCDWARTQSPYVLIIKNSDTSLLTTSDLECLGFEHNIYLICALIGILLYYPLSAYTMPNFQFSEKRLDLKYKPSYLIIYFQVNFILAAGKVLLSQIEVPSTEADVPTQQVQVTQLIFQSLNILSLLILGFSVTAIKPCLIKWFNYVELMVISIGVIWNVMGLTLYLNGSGGWLVCVIVACLLTLITIIGFTVFLRKTYFGGLMVAPMETNEEIQELENNWKSRKQYNKDLIRMRKLREEHEEIQQSHSQDNTNEGVQLKSNHRHPPPLTGRNKELFDVFDMEQ